MLPIPNIEPLTVSSRFPPPNVLDPEIIGREKVTSIEKTSLTRFSLGKENSVMFSNYNSIIISSLVTATGSAWHGG